MLILFLLVLVLIFPNSCFSGQPVFDSAPRWAKGYGIQTRYEASYSDTLLKGHNKINNPHDLYRDVHKSWIEGVYVFKPQIRTTFKIPMVYQSRKIIRDGKAIKQKGSGIGDMELAVLFKNYRNWQGGTQELGFVPMLRLPTGITKGGFPAGDGSTDAGFSLFYKWESFRWAHVYDCFYWINNNGVSGIHPGDEFGIDGNFGYHFFHDKKKACGSFIWLNWAFRNQQDGVDRGTMTGTTRLSMGPALVFYWKNIIFRGEYRLPVYEHVNGIDVSNGQEVNIGLGIAF